MCQLQTWQAAELRVRAAAAQSTYDGAQQARRSEQQGEAGQALRAASAAQEVELQRRGARAREQQDVAQQAGQQRDAQKRAWVDKAQVRMLAVAGCRV